MSKPKQKIKATGSPLDLKPESFLTQRDLQQAIATASKAIRPYLNAD